jgi:hypothetical protein
MDHGIPDNSHFLNKKPSSHPEIFCVRCSIREATMSCDCNECVCASRLCNECFGLTRCRTCVMHCRNWLFSFFQKPKDNVSIATIALPLKALPLKKSQCNKPISPIAKMKIFPILAEWENKRVFYLLDMTNPTHRHLLFRSKYELESEIHLQKCAFTIRVIESDLVQALKSELSSITAQYEHEKSKLDTKCKYCFDIESMNSEEKLRHDDYHIHTEVLQLKKQNACDEITRISMKSSKKYSLQNSTNNAKTQVDADIHVHELLVEKLFQNIVFIPPPPPHLIEKRMQTSDDMEEEEEEPSLKRQKRPFILWQSQDNTRCKTCGDELCLGFDEDQDWSYNKNAYRINDTMYCSLGCVQDRLYDIQIEQPIRKQDDNQLCPKCSSFIAYYQSGNMVFYYNDFIYDGGCSGNVCKGNSCAALRVDTTVYCNATCAQLVRKPRAHTDTH